MAGAAHRDVRSGWDRYRDQRELRRSTSRVPVARGATRRHILGRVGHSLRPEATRPYRGDDRRGWSSARALPRRRSAGPSGALGRGHVLREQLVDQESDRGKEHEVHGVAADVRGLGDEPGDHQHPDADPASAMTRRGAHISQASARILFMQDHLRSAAGGESVFRGLSVYTGNAHPRFAKDICSYLDIPIGDVDVFKFANDEIFVQIKENAREHDVFVVQSLVGPSVSDAIMELLIMLDAFKRASAGRITAVMPYYAYGRSDKKDQPRVPITARLLADLIGVAGSDRFLTMDMHQMQIQGFFSIPGDELSARNLLVEAFREIVEKDPDGVVLVVPDLGYANVARRIAEALEIPLVFMQKTHRDNSGRSEVVALRPSAAATGKIEVLTVAPLFAEAIRRIHEGESVGVLFHPPGLQLPLQVN